MSECYCNEHRYKEQTIAAGLAEIPRQIGSFADFRASMLSKIRDYPALSHWRPCGQEDLGLMLLEMWAYMLDVQSFYDEVLGHEMWIGTARQRSSVRKLIDLLGYVPRPAVAAVASLALTIEGRKSILLEAGTGFRSGAFNGLPPQIFETTNGSNLHPLNNSWQVIAPKQTTLLPGGDAFDTSFPTLLVRRDTLLKSGDLVLISIKEESDVYRQMRTIVSVTDHESINGEPFKKIAFNSAITLRGDFILEDITIDRAVHTAGLWTKAKVSGDPDAIDGKKIVLDALYRRLIAANDFVVLQRTATRRWFQVESAADAQMTIAPAGSATLTDVDNNTSNISIPAVKAPITQLTMKQTVEQDNWRSADTDLMTLYYGFESAAQVVAEPANELGSDDTLDLDTGRKNALESPMDLGSPARFLLQDKNLDGVMVSGSVDYQTAQLALDNSDSFKNLVMPVNAFGNVIEVSRGESVNGEILGSGDATLANQFFKLKKGPLTYLNAATASNELGVVSSLSVYVDGVRWQEVSNFYGTGAEDTIYTVRQGDEDESIVFFGDGRYGSRLPTGVNNIVAYYRFGAGRDAPPAESISQLVKPIDGVNGVEQVLKATAGDDAESREALRALAPRSALLLGRAISIEDIKVVASNVAGVEAVHAEWRWQARQQRPAAQVWYLGDVEKTIVLEKIGLLVSPSVPVDATQVIKFPLHLSIELEIDEEYLEKDVLEEVYSLLVNEETGILLPAHIGFDQSLVRSRLFFELLSVDGVLNVTGLAVTVFGITFPWEEGIIPLPLELFIDFVAGGISLNGKEF